MLSINFRVSKTNHWSDVSAKLNVTGYFFAMSVIVVELSQGIADMLLIQKQILTYISQPRHC